MPSGSGRVKRGHARQRDFVIDPHAGLISKIISGKSYARVMAGVALDD
jgi:hypothetical protein